MVWALLVLLGVPLWWGGALEVAVVAERRSALLGPFVGRRSSQQGDAHEAAGALEGSKSVTSSTGAGTRSGGNGDDRSAHINGNFNRG